MGRLDWLIVSLSVKPAVLVPILGTLSMGKVLWLASGQLWAGATL